MSNRFTFTEREKTGPFWFAQREYVAPFLHRYQEASGLLFSVTRAIKKYEFKHGGHSAIARKGAALAASNRALAEIDSRLKIHDLNLSWSDDAVKDWCESRAAKCGRLDVDKVKAMLERYGLEFPQYDLFGEPAAMARCADTRWWRRQVRKLQARTMDQIARDLRTVHRQAQPYCADETVRRRKTQKHRNSQLLESLEAENEDGDKYTLAELASLSVSRPDVRRAELMVRMRGFEEVAQDCGHSGLFITMTAPSEYHPCREIRTKKNELVRVVPNPKYENFSPRDAQAYLCKVWAKVRAALKRREIGIYGFRVAEPHNDGTPHWHFMLFGNESDFDAIKRVFFRCTLRTGESRREVWRYRLKFVGIDPAKGTAAGYIAKYISKNIDGYGVGNDSGADLFASESAQRIEAWAGAWGLRQFQQIGGPSVTVWRELRRIETEEGEPLEAVRDAADRSDWRAFVHLMGGPFCGRDGQPVRPALWQPIDVETGEIDCMNRYGEESRGRLFGVRIVATGRHVLTRFYTWTIHRIRQAESVVDDWLEYCRQNFSARGSPRAALDLCQ